MTETTALSSPAVAPASPAPVVTPPPAPVVDVEKIVRDATESATKAANEIASKNVQATLAKVGQALSGEVPPNKSDEFLKNFVAAPEKVLSNVIDIAVNRTETRNNQVNAVNKIQREVVAPFVNEYPELKSPNKFALIEKLAGDKERSGIPYAEALKSACEETVKEFGLKSVSEAERQSGYGAGLPSGGAARNGAPIVSEEKSQSDFITGMRARSNSFRTKKSA